MFYLQRNDVNMRNEWSNYSNWPYDKVLPYNVHALSNSTDSEKPYIYNTNGTLSSIITVGEYNKDNERNILETMGILFDGEYRENTLTRGIYDYIEKYTRTNGSAKEGLYCYNFCLNTSPYEYQPSGAINLSKFKTIEFEISTFIPPVDPIGSEFNVICDQNGTTIGVSKKPAWSNYYYTYNMTVFEERYNILSFISGNAGMLYSR